MGKLPDCPGLFCLGHSIIYQVADNLFERVPTICSIYGDAWIDDHFPADVLHGERYVVFPVLLVIPIADGVAHTFPVSGAANFNGVGVLVALRRFAVSVHQLLAVDGLRKEVRWLATSRAHSMWGACPQ